MVELVPLFKATLAVAPPHNVGEGPAGTRMVGELPSVTVEGDRIRATLAGPAAADWMVRTGTIAIVDVRMTLRTHDDALVYVSYGGRLNLAVKPLVAYTAPVFETGDERYAWLNGIQAVAKGTFTEAGLVYDVYEVR